MSGLMGSFYIGTAGLTTAQRGLNTVAHNLSNVETKGYVRQQTLLTQSYVRVVGENINDIYTVGYGSETEAIRHIRDEFLDKQYREEYGRKGFYDAEYEAVSEITEIFGEIEGVAFQNSIQDLWVSIQELCKEPDNIVCRSSLIQTAVSFVERASNIQDQINEYQLNLNSKVQDAVDKINQIAQDIYDLNQKIRLYEANKVEHANDLRDERDKLLDELSSYVSISYKEEIDNTVRVTVEGYSMVAGDSIFLLDTKTVDGSGGMISPYWPTYQTDLFDFTFLPTSENRTDVGYLKGLILSRGTKVAHYTDIPVEPNKSDFETDAEYEAAMSQYQKDKKTYTHDIESCAVANVQAQFDQLIHGITTTLNDLFAPNKKMTIVNPDTGATETIMVLDEEKASIGNDLGKTMGEALFNRKSMNRYEEKTVSYIDENGDTQTKKVKVYNEEDPDNNYSLFTLGEIEVNPAILKDSSKLPFNKNDDSGEFDLGLAADIMAAWQADFATLSPNQLNYNNFNEYYTAMIGDMATRGEQFNIISKNQESLTNTVDNERSTVTAVSSDEELTMLIKFQHAYNASARYVNAVSEMLEHIINAFS